MNIHFAAAARVIASREADGLALIRWSLGHVHIAGRDTVLLTYHAADPGHHWRAAANDAARLIVTAVGGLAWDERGVVRLVVPHDYAADADRIMREVRAFPAPEEDSRNVAGNVGSPAVWATIDRPQGGLASLALAWTDNPGDPRPVVLRHTLDGERHLFWWVAGHTASGAPIWACVVKAPVGWSWMSESVEPAADAARLAA